MREYYRHARAIYRAAMRALEANEAQSSSLFAQFRDWRSRLSNADFSVHRERAHFRAPQRLDVEPGAGAAPVRIRGAPRHPRLVREPSSASKPRLDQPCATTSPSRGPSGRRSNQILSLPHAPLAVRAMHETGVLTAIFPELEQIECLVIRDFYHRYTVDEHTLVRHARACSDAGAADAYADLLAEVQQPGRADVRAAVPRFRQGIARRRPRGRVRCGWRSTAMARIRMPAAGPRDRAVPDPAATWNSPPPCSRATSSTRKPSATWRTRWRPWSGSRPLTLLTYADISAVNPNAMTPWRAEQLWQLYLMVYNELTRELETDRIETVPAGPPERVEFLQGFPTRYLRTHTEAEIDEHMALEERSRKRGVAVEIRKLESAWQLTLVAADRPGLFASVAGTLSSFGMNILKAEAFSNRRGLVLDTFTFADPHPHAGSESHRGRPPARHRRARDRRQDRRARSCCAAVPSPRCPAARRAFRRRSRSIREASDTATLVEIVAEDRPGLLYDLASAISSNGGNIEVVLIDTQAHKAIDVFYVTADGRKLGAGEAAGAGRVFARCLLTRPSCRPHERLPGRPIMEK